ncbi:MULTISPECIES: phospholipase D-like domain-containing protein [Halocynthiibacter]|uniref:Phospholipase D n=1 Tax=Halocynthiibacter halioticoli TaxID=2986804 RepID=A0AAE3IZA7_9RHOB|nr:MULTISPECIES: phospholipase D-like domain-containing protein [Halocynthiibacter]MCV6824845.1 phospholipase D-like domain-containing protein [Halocynthiibacter halioticoli]MCW4057846.1 phospholipase D-like domain-containing protein [Halocynthiibacter sp. SDUM655004]
MNAAADLEQNNSLFEEGRNCWRVETAYNYDMVVDGAAYFKALREALIIAQHQVMLIGWDFDLEIEMLPGASDDSGIAPDGYPNRVRGFLEALVEERPELDMYILRWSGSTIVAPGRLVPAMRLRFNGPKDIRIALDGRHPVSACHHQKIVVIDDAVAFCGGIDVTDARWDTPDHAPNDPRRVLRNGEYADPWHDLTNAVTGAAAQALGDLARTRWNRSTGEYLAAPTPSDDDYWPASLPVACRNVRVAISRTEPPEEDQALINEIEEMVLDQIASANSVIYMESQYFASDEIATALSRRLSEDDGPDIIIINPNEAQKEVEDKAMHVTRTRLIQQLRKVDHENRFRIASPVNAAEEAIYVHAKVCIVDDKSIRIGSSNINRRSLGFDTECDLTVEARSSEVGEAIECFRNRLLAEHLGCEVSVLKQKIADEGRVAKAFDALNKETGRGLRDIKHKEDTGFGSFLANTRMLDPRYERGTESRTRFSGRHIGFGIAVLCALAFLFHILTS